MLLTSIENNFASLAVLNPIFPDFAHNRWRFTLRMGAFARAL
jgi:hypothetical protein